MLVALGIYILSNEPIWRDWHKQSSLLCCALVATNDWYQLMTNSMRICMAHAGHCWRAAMAKLMYTNDDYSACMR